MSLVSEVDVSVLNGTPRGKRLHLSRGRLPNDDYIIIPVNEGEARRAKLVFAPSVRKLPPLENNLGLNG